MLFCGVCPSCAHVLSLIAPVSTLARGEQFPQLPPLLFLLSALFCVPGSERTKTSGELEALKFASEVEHLVGGHTCG